MSEPANTLAIEARDLQVERGQFPVFAPVSLRLGRGELVCLQGRNGAGKTTLLRCLAGFIDHAAGSLKSQPGLRTLYLGHRLPLKPELSCRESLRFQTRLFARPEPHQGWLEGFGLAGYERSRVRHLSAGQRKRLALAMLVACDGSLWLLDEPYANLDASGQAMVDQLLADHLAGGGAALIAAHDRAPRLSQAFATLKVVAA